MLAAQFQIEPQGSDGEFGLLFGHLLSAFVRFGGEQTVEAVLLPLSDTLHHPQHGTHRPVGVLGIDRATGIAHHDHFGSGCGIDGKGNQQTGNNKVDFSH